MQRPGGKSMPRVFGEQQRSRCGANKGQAEGDAAAEKSCGDGAVLQIMRRLVGHNNTSAFILSEIRTHLSRCRRSHVIYVLTGSLWLSGREYSQGGKGGSRETSQEDIAIN